MLYFFFFYSKIFTWIRRKAFAKMNSTLRYVLCSYVKVIMRISCLFLNQHKLPNMTFNDVFKFNRIAICSK